jgi:hypothetical protein
MTAIPATFRAFVVAAESDGAKGVPSAIGAPGAPAAIAGVTRGVRVFAEADLPPRSQGSAPSSRGSTLPARSLPARTRRSRWGPRFSPTGTTSA